MLGAGDTAPAGDALRILEPVLESPDEILAGLRRGALEQLRIRVEEVRRRGGFQQQPPGEIHARQVGISRCGRRGERLFPPGSPVAVGARVGVEGPDVPGGVGESEVCVTGGERRTARGTGHELQAVEGLLVGAVRELSLPRRLSGELQVPLPPGLEIVIGSQPSGEGRELSPQLARNLGLRRGLGTRGRRARFPGDRKSTRLNSSHVSISYAVFCLKKKKTKVSVALV